MLLKEGRMTLFGDPFARLIITGLSLGAIGGVAVGWATVCLVASLRGPGLQWLRASRGSPLRLIPRVRRANVCPTCGRAL